MTKTDFVCLGTGVFFQGYAMLPYDWVNGSSALLGMGLAVGPVLNVIFKEISGG